MDIYVTGVVVPDFDTLMTVMGITGVDKLDVEVDEKLDDDVRDDDVALAVEFEEPVEDKDNLDDFEPVNDEVLEVPAKEPVALPEDLVLEIPKGRLEPENDPRVEVLKVGRPGSSTVDLSKPTPEVVRPLVMVIFELAARA